MPIFPERGCAFVHVPKTAGTSVMDALARACGAAQYAGAGLWEILAGADDPQALALAVRASFRISTLRDFPQQHLPARALREIVGLRRWDALFTFAFVRNPWDLVVSTFHFSREHTARAAPLGIDPDLAELHARARTFEEFVGLYTVMRSDMTEMLVDSQGREIVKYVARYESLDDDFARICERLGIAANLERRNVSDHQGYRQYYDSRTRAIVERHFARDISRFGYRF